ncbi:2-succinyl-5-enolpyruvyl-6-hydroxy-3-cyclohexene- 1-carboxylic-acid synthase [Algoriphagus sp. oki45]|uniref:2-succinyl-5-enolpyruvyl-6-hydroxy-3- cyclohexene-1-carboxylic-acid synthase n=1 Tax=Algoriphagus sp. oki45 TaxID=3067294 RepID=UPI0027FB6AB9|nr:2-succinyl-5-enolpyruvyl-6-hydroxy-3-cyclohexene- 1-carboxylic-acid synthase [Algoriphagus sp. oki45]
MTNQIITDLVAICAKKGIENAILSPGSRCAPLTLAFARHPEIHARTISDERSAAFIALGMAQKLNQPVVLVCTSGSAALNYYPAIAEAFFQEVPLLILTADRPSEWIDQWDGQTIYQQEVYGKHVKKSFQFPDSLNSSDQIWYAHRIVNEAINLAKTGPAGPVHINIPLREPFYPKKGEQFIASKELHIVHPHPSCKQLSHEALEQLKAKLAQVNRLVIIPGQQKPNPKIKKLLKQLALQKKVVTVTDTISNLSFEESISFHDHWLGNEKISEGLAPDLILTFGKSLISKPLKQFLRRNPLSHWHIQAHEGARDPFQHLTRHLDCDPLYFLEWLAEHIPSMNESYFSRWQSLESKVKENLPEILSNAEFGEYQALHRVIRNIPENSKIHLANSMPVRYMNFLGKIHQEISCNRGTSGIDGTNSSAVGCAFTTKDPVTIITGDMAFFYDRNAFWHNYSIANLRIILLNNHAGGIFRLIDGPKDQPELEEFFETKQALNGQSLAKEFGFGYSLVTQAHELDSQIKELFAPGMKAKILEIQSESPKNTEILSLVKEKIKLLLEE